MRYLHTLLKRTVAFGIISKRTLREPAMCFAYSFTVFSSPQTYILSRHRGYGRAVGTSSRCPL